MKFNKKKEERKSNMKHTLPKLNLILIAISFVLIVIGFALMVGEPSGEVYNPYSGADDLAFRLCTDVIFYSIPQ